MWHKCKIVKLIPLRISSAIDHADGIIALKIDTKIFWCMLGGKWQDWRNIKEADAIKTIFRLSDFGLSKSNSDKLELKPSAEDMHRGLHKIKIINKEPAEKGNAIFTVKSKLNILKIRAKEDAYKIGSIVDPPWKDIGTYQHFLRGKIIDKKGTEDSAFEELLVDSGKMVITIKSQKNKFKIGQHIETKGILQAIIVQTGESSRGTK